MQVCKEIMSLPATWSVTQVSQGATSKISVTS
jgi:hypothetical protein